MPLTVADVMTAPSLTTAQKTIEEIVAEAAAGERSKTHSLDLELLRKDGTTVWSEVTAGPLCDESERLMGILGVARNISDRREMEHERALTTQRIESLLALNHMSERPMEEIVATAIEDAIRLTGSQIGYLAFGQ